MGIGFAYGGLVPGRLHAHGQLVETHEVHYSVGASGKYLLHVYMRQTAEPLPGSPFALTVAAGRPHPLGTRLEPSLAKVLPKSSATSAQPPPTKAPAPAPTRTPAGSPYGRVPHNWQPPPQQVVAPPPPDGWIGCLRLRSRDKMGNLCAVGGADVTCGCEDANVKAETIDNQDGTYELKWTTSAPGIYSVEVKMEGIHVQGSPTLMRIRPKAKPKVPT